MRRRHAPSSYWGAESSGARRALVIGRTWPGAPLRSAAICLDCARFPYPGHSSMAKTYAIAIVGIGKITEDQHLPCIAKNPRFKLAGLVSQRGVSREGVPSFKTLGALLSSGTAVDAVAICTPPNARHAIAVEAMDAGKHVLLEKPPTATTLETADLVAHAALTKRVAYATWHSQHNAAVDEAKRLLTGQRVKRLHVEWKEDVKRWHPGQEW